MALHAEELMDERSQAWIHFQLVGIAIALLPVGFVMFKLRTIYTMGHVTEVQGTLTMFLLVITLACGRWVYIYGARLARKGTK